MEPISTSSTTMSTPSSCPSTITPAQKIQSPHIIPSDEKPLSSQPHLPPSVDINYLPQPQTKVIPTEPSNANFHKNSLEILSIHILNLVHKEATNIPPIPSSSTTTPCENRTKFEYLNLHQIFGCRQLCNKKHLTTAENKILFNLGLLPSTFVSFATIINPLEVKTINKQS